MSNEEVWEDIAPERHNYLVFAMGLMEAKNTAERFDQVRIAFSDSGLVDQNDFFVSAEKVTVAELLEALRRKAESAARKAYRVKGEKTTTLTVATETAARLRKAGISGESADTLVNRVVNNYEREMSSND